MWIQSNFKYQDGYIDTVANPLYVMVDSNYETYLNYFDGSIGPNGRWVIQFVYPGTVNPNIGLTVGFQAMTSGNQTVNASSKYMFTFNGRRVFRVVSGTKSGYLWYSGDVAPNSCYGGVTFDSSSWYYTGAVGDVEILNTGIQGAQSAGYSTYVPYASYKLPGNSPIGTYSVVNSPSSSYGPVAYKTSWMPFGGWQLPDGATSRLGRYELTSGGSAYDPHRAYMYVGFMRLKDTVSGRIFRQYRKNEAFYYHNNGIQGSQGQDFLGRNSRIVAKSDDGYYLWSLKNPSRFLVTPVLDEGLSPLKSTGWRSITPVWWASVLDKLETTYDLSYNGFGPRPSPEQMNIVIDGYEDCPDPQWVIDSQWAYTYNMPFFTVFDAPLVR